MLDPYNLFAEIKVVLSEQSIIFKLEKNFLFHWDSWRTLRAPTDTVQDK